MQKAKDRLEGTYIIYMIWFDKNISVKSCLNGRHNEHIMKTYNKINFQKKSIFRRNMKIITIFKSKIVWFFFTYIYNMIYNNIIIYIL